MSYSNPKALSSFLEQYSKALGLQSFKWVLNDVNLGFQTVTQIEIFQKFNVSIHLDANEMDYISYLTDLFKPLQTDIENNALCADLKETIRNKEQAILFLEHKVKELEAYKVHYDLNYKMEHGKDVN